MKQNGATLPQYLRLHRQHGVERDRGAAALHVDEADLAEERFVFSQRAFFSFRAGEHVQALHLRPAGA